MGNDLSSGNTFWWVDEVGLSATHLDRLLVQETGLTMHQHLNNRRLVTAQDALLAK